nr:YjiH family protein [Alkalihalobacterium bogoriense]
MAEGKGKEKQPVAISGKAYVWFILPSLIGIFLFMIPIQYDDSITIPVAILANELKALLGESTPYIVTVMLFFVSVMSIIGTALKPESLMNRPFLKGLFIVHPAWVVTRVLGFIFATMTVFEWGPEAVWSEYTGAIVMNDLIPVLFTIFLFAGLFLPLLLNFGLLELFGTLLNKVMRPLFTLPGRSSVDCMASWMGDGTVGILLTNKQYEEGFYTKREAAVIGTTFSVVSITFSIVILEYLELTSMFLPFYFTVVVAGFVAAVICPRIPPLSRKPNEYIVENKDRPQEDNAKNGESLLKVGFNKAAYRAQNNEGIGKTIKGGFQNVLDMWLGVIPIVMAVGTVALIFAENTPLFHYLGLPFIPLLEWMQVPHAAEAAQTMVIGFADMLLPAIIGSGIESEFTRFVIACVSITQLIYMSEVGGLLLASKIPVRFLDLVIIFLQRTLITLPIIVGMAHLIFWLM